MAARTLRSLNQRNEIDIDRRRMDATMLLVKAIGGGWDTTQLQKY
jgi:outer membrane protein TolC